MKKMILSLIGAAAIVSAAYGATTTNRGNVVSTTTLDELISAQDATNTVQDTSQYAGARGQRGTIVRWFRVAKNGGTAGGSLNWDPAVAIPSNAIVIGGYVEVTTGFVPATNLLSIGLNSSADILAATTNLSVAARRAIIPVWTVGTSVKATNNLQLKLNADADNADFTAGVGNIVLEYYLGQ